MAISSIPDYHASLDPTDKAICDRLRLEIDAGLPEAEARMWHAHPVWFLDGNPIVGYSKLKSCVRLMFWSGQSFDAPGLRPTGTFKAGEARFVDVAEIDPQAMAAWLSDSRTIQWDYKNIVKRKGRLERLL